MKITRTFIFGLTLLVGVSATVQKAAAQIPCGPSINPLQVLSVNWPQYRFDAKRSGCNPYEHIVNASNVGSLTTKWQTSTPLALGHSPVLVNGVLYADNYAFNALTGALLWDNGIVTLAPPAVVNGVEYIGVGTYPNTFVDAVNTADGTILWSFPTGHNVYSSPTVVNGVVYVGCEDDNVYALNAATGALVWKYTTQSYIDASPAVTNGVVYIGSADHNLYALDAATGSLLWKYMTFGKILSSPSVAGNTVYVGSSSPDLYFYALNATTGALVWKSQMNPIGYGAGRNSPAVANGVVYVFDEYANLYAYNANTGAVVWTYSPGPIPLLDANPVIANGVLYWTNVILSSALALDARTGTPLWTYYNADDVPVSPPIVANGVVYFVGSTGGENNPSGVVWAFHLPGQ